MPLKRSLVQRELDDSSSDDDDYVIFSAAQIVHTYSNAKRSHGGSVLGHRVLYRDRKGGHERMFQDYLAVNPTYTPQIFRIIVSRFFHFGLVCIICRIIVRVLKI